MTQYHLYRRGFDLGKIRVESSDKADPLENWQHGLAVKLPNFCRKEIDRSKQYIKQTESLVYSIWEEQELAKLLEYSPYQERLEKQFTKLGSGVSEGDQQEIETVFFDGMENGEAVAQDLWVKNSWLSFFDEDASLRFRFSFGVDLEQDVASDPHRQQFAADLCDKIFPESKILSDHQELSALLKKLLKQEQLNFVERIIYFNAPQGGAYLHHDLERGHAGVVYAQLSGETFWLALPRAKLIEAIREYSRHHYISKEIAKLCTAPEILAKELDSFANDELIALINETPEFIKFLHNAGFSQVMRAGDVLLLPQSSSNKCCWHSVFCLGDEVGQALSFAIR